MNAPVSELEFHPIANLLCQSEESGHPGERDLSKLIRSIKKFALRTPIILYEGRILDGRNRYRACKFLGIRPRFVQFEGSFDEAVETWAKLNCPRYGRRYSKGQKAAAAVRLCELINARSSQ